jgi:hypothetical protein
LCIKLFLFWMNCRPTVRCFSPLCICSQITANTLSFESMQCKLHIACNVYFCATVLYFWMVPDLIKLFVFLDGCNSHVTLVSVWTLSPIQTCLRNVVFNVCSCNTGWWTGFTDLMVQKGSRYFLNAPVSPITHFSLWEINHKYNKRNVSIFNISGVKNPVSHLEGARSFSVKYVGIFWKTLENF